MTLDDLASDASLDAAFAGAARAGRTGRTTPARGPSVSAGLPRSPGWKPTCAPAVTTSSPCNWSPSRMGRRSICKTDVNAYYESSTRSAPHASLLRTSRIAACSPFWRGGCATRSPGAVSTGRVRVALRAAVPEPVARGLFPDALDTAFARPYPCATWTMCRCSHRRMASCAGPRAESDPRVAAPRQASRQDVHRSDRAGVRFPGLRTSPVGLDGGAGDIRAVYSTCGPAFMSTGAGPMIPRLGRTGGVGRAGRPAVCPLEGFLLRASPTLGCRDGGAAQCPQPW